MTETLAPLADIWLAVAPVIHAVGVLTLRALLSPPSPYTIFTLAFGLTLRWQIRTWAVGEIIKACIYGMIGFILAATVAGMLGGLR